MKRFRKRKTENSENTQKKNRGRWRKENGEGQGGREGGRVAGRREGGVGEVGHFPQRKSKFVNVNIRLSSKRTLR